MPGNSGDLLPRFREGEHEAVRSVARLARAVIGFRGHLIPSGEREDLVQEVVVQVYRVAIEPEFRPSVAFEAFVRSVAQRRCVDWTRLRRRSEPIESDLPGSTSDPEQEVISAEKWARARRAIAALGFSCRRLIRLRVREGLSYREIAQRLERSEQAVRVQMYKCLNKAKGLLAPVIRREAGNGGDDGD